MASFTKTIPAGKTEAEVEALLAGRDHFLRPPQQAAPLPV